jgi:hypothetical protein
VSLAVVTTHALVEEILDSWRQAIGGDLPGYRGHVYRTLNLCRALAPSVDADRIAVAAAFHDLGLWPEGTLDYLPASVGRATDWLDRGGRASWSREVALAIDLHHKLTPYRGANAAFVEAFRRADLVDVSRGLYPAGLPREFLRDVFAAFPDAGFRARVVRLVLGWAVTHPLRPLPVLRW